MLNHWLYELETSFIIHRPPAWHANIRKQVVKAPKLHFIDSGLACYLLGIHEPEQLRHHPLRGPIFESWVVSELYKTQLHNGEQPNMYHYRESRGVEIDLLIDRGEYLHAIEVKSGATASSDFFKQFRDLPAKLRNTRLPQDIRNHVVYGGVDSLQRSQGRLVSWHDVTGIL